jgi:hypothetical protein
VKLSIKFGNVKIGFTENIDSHIKRVILIRSRIKENLIINCIHTSINI